MKAMIKAGLLVFLVGGVTVLPLGEAGAHTRCHTVYKHGVYKQVCTTEHGRPDYRPYRPHHYYDGYERPGYRYRTVCDTYWRDGVKHRSCRKVRVRY